MKKVGFLMLLIGGLAFAVESMSKEIYYAEIFDSQGNIHKVSDIIVRDPYNKTRGREGHSLYTKRGDSNQSIPFNKIKEINLVGELKDNYVPVIIRFTSGEEEKFLIYLRVSDKYYGKTTWGDSFSIEIEKAKKVIFKHDGRFKKCPLCNTLFYNTEMTECPFDGESLIYEGKLLKPARH